MKSIDEKWDEYKNATEPRVFYAKQTKSNSKGNISGMSHHVEHFDAMYDKMAIREGRLLHEMICPDSICRVYIDLDGSDVEMTLEQQNEVRDEVKLGIEAAFKDEFGRNGTGKWSEWTASRPHHVSLHLIWNVAFKTPHHVKALVLKAFPSQKIRELTIDVGLYPMKKPRPFRLPYCGKRVGNQTKFYLEPLNQEDIGMTPYALALGSVTFHAGLSEKYTLPVIGEVYSMRNVDNPVDYTKGELSTDNNAACAVYEEITRRYQCNPPTGMYSYVDGTFKFRTQMCCVNIGAWHKSNGQQVYNDAYGFIYVMCYDDRCKGKIFKLPFTVNMLMQAKDKISINFNNKRLKI